MLKRILAIILFFILINFQIAPILASTIKVPDGTPITICTDEEIDADDVQLSQQVDFFVQQPVYINGQLVVKTGTLVTGQVSKLKNNSIFGISGEIQINNFQLKHSNSVIYLRGNIQNKGQNRAWVNAGWLFFVTLPLIFVKGNDGKIPTGTYQTLYTVGDNYIETTL